jgi:hypothetical protein
MPRAAVFGCATALRLRLRVPVRAALGRMIATKAAMGAARDSEDPATTGRFVVRQTRRLRVDGGEHGRWRPPRDSPPPGHPSDCLKYVASAI